MDLSQLSDEQLLQQLGQSDATSPDLSGMSNEQLLSALDSYQEPPSVPESIWNTAKQYGSGVIEGTAGLAGMAGDVGEFGAKQLATTLFPALRLAGVKPEFDMDMPNTQAAVEMVQPIVAERNDSNVADRYARTLGEFTGPGGVAGVTGKALKVAGKAPALVNTIKKLSSPKMFLADSTAAIGAQGAEDYTGNETIAPIVGGVFGAAAPSIFRSGSGAVRQIFKGANQKEVQGTAGEVMRDLSNLTPEQLDDIVANRVRGDLEDYRTTAEITKDAPLAQLQSELAGHPDFSGQYNTRVGARQADRDVVLDGMSKIEGVADDFGETLVETAHQTKRDLLETAHELWQKFPREIQIDSAASAAELEKMLDFRQAGLPNKSHVQTLVNQFIEAGTPSPKAITESVPTGIYDDSGKMIAKEVTKEAPQRTKGTTGALQDIRSDALAVKRDAKITDREGSYLSAIQKNVDEDLKRQLSGADYDNYIQGRAVTSYTKDLFGRSAVGGTLTNEALAAENAMNKAFPGSKKKAVQLKQVLASKPELIEDVKRAILDLVPRDADEVLQPAAFRKWLRGKKTGLIEIFGEEHYENMARVLDDMRSEKGVNIIAGRASKGNSITSQKETVAGALDNIFDVAVAGSTGVPFGNLIRKFSAGSSIKEKKQLRNLLFQAAMDPELARQLMKTPTEHTMKTTIERLSQLSTEISKATKRAVILEQAASIQAAPKSASPEQPQKEGYSSIWKNQESQVLDPSNKPRLVEAPPEAAQPIKNPSAPFDLEQEYIQPNAEEAALERIITAKPNVNQKEQEVNNDDAEFDLLVKSVIKQESAGNPKAKSHKGAQGLMQLMPATGKEVMAKLGLDPKDYDPYDPELNVKLGTAYLEEQHDQFGDVELALAAYNMGPGALRRMMREAQSNDWNQISEYMKRKGKYKETRDYVPKIMANYQRLLFS